MSARESLYAAAIARHQREARKYGITSLAFILVAVPLGNSDNLLNNWLSFFFVVTAFFSFARYAGERHPLESLRHRLDFLPPKPPLPTISHEVESLVRKYGGVLERFAGETLINISALPAPKSKMKRVLATSIQHCEDPADKAILQQGYLYLSFFQPIPEGSRELASAAALEDLLELGKELNALPLIQAPQR